MSHADDIRCARLGVSSPRDAAAPVEVTRDDLVGFFRAGGVLRLTEWLGWGEAARDLAAEAGNTVAAERALLLSLCLSGGAEEVSRVVDGGQAADEQALTSALNRALSGGKVVRDG